MVDEDMTATAKYTSDGRQWINCGDICNPFSSTDFDFSCQVNLDDLAILAEDWPTEPGESLQVLNNSFEGTGLIVGDSDVGAPGWLPVNAETPLHPVVYCPGFAADGRNLATMSQFSAEFYQPVYNHTFEADTTYRFMVDLMVPSYDDGVVWTPDAAWWKLYLQSQNPEATLPASLEDDIPSSPEMVYDQWYTISCDFDSSTDPARVGEGIQILFKGASVYVDNFRLVKMEEPGFGQLLTLAEEWLVEVP